MMGYQLGVIDMLEVQLVADSLSFSCRHQRAT